jgi:hypothetical protein
MVCLAGCAGGSGTSAGTASTSAAQNVVTNSISDHNAAVQCLSDFDSCTGKASTVADFDACKATLDGCLPSRPPGPIGADICGEHDGPPPQGPPPQGQPPPPQDGQPPPPPDGGMGGMHCGFGGPPADVCKQQLDACVAAASVDVATCVQQAHQCVHAAIIANFQAACAHILDECQKCASSSADCTNAQTVCASGVPFGDTP